MQRPSINLGDNKMSEVKTDLQYTPTHEWLKDNGDGTWKIGITDHAQALLGDIVFVELPSVGDNIDPQEELCVVESVKAASGVYAPADVEVVEVNQNLDDEPEIINADCYDKGWVVIFKASSIDGLLDAGAYQDLLDTE